MCAAVTEVLHDGYMGRLASIRTLQLLAGMDNLTAAKCCCVSPHTYRRWRSDRRPNPTAMRLLAISRSIMCRRAAGKAGRCMTASGSHAVPATGCRRHRSKACRYSSPWRTISCARHRRETPAVRRPAGDTGPVRGGLLMALRVPPETGGNHSLCAGSLRRLDHFETVSPHSETVCINMRGYMPGNAAQ